jgi:hypothetical protein
MNAGLAEPEDLTVRAGTSGKGTFAGAHIYAVLVLADSLRFPEGVDDRDSHDYERRVEITC